MVTTKDQIDFIEKLAAAHTTIVEQMNENADIRRLLQVSIHNIDIKERKMINGMLRTTICEHTGYTAGELEMIAVRFHENTTLGLVSTTESDIVDLVYYYDLDNLIDQLKVIEL
jgi:hypothetical protein